ncbi:ankyrin repeat-containing protein-like [Dorcoceras hygrometricum]|uniref:Ankyrin repeat-containing protein-like n=1 Tax=Dorcoceras hygrometricum TaxID=472368 RepID=A0A2Z7A998_9LAMI|nr:ankyrin repeat-containing protein-like [Dorcoceras hygrometricum]
MASLDVAAPIRSTSSNPAAVGDGKDKDYTKYLALYRAIMRGDWMESEKLLDKDIEARTANISEFEETALHVAMETGRKSNDFVRKLLVTLPNDVLLRKNSFGNTALHRAATIGNREAVIMLVNRNPELQYILNRSNRLPIHQAAIHGHKKTLVYLISVSRKDVDNSPFTGHLGASLLAWIMASHFIDVALDLVLKYPDLATISTMELGLYALEVIASLGSAFPSGANFNWWQKWIYSSIASSTTTKYIAHDLENISSNHAEIGKSTWLQIISKIPFVKSIKDKKVMHQQALELVKCSCRALESLPSSVSSPIYQRAIIMAARKGIHEVVEVIIEMFPTAIYTTDTKTGGTIFHVAARNRIQNVFNLLYRINEQSHYFYDRTDSSGNNYMHMCGELAPPLKLNLVSGAALQMQRELQWFKEMENFVSPSRRTWENNEGKTPQMLFTEKHGEMKVKGEKWMKQTASSCSIAATLIATVVFDAAFSVPGSIDPDSGLALFLKDTSFIIFAISDSVSLFTSITSLLMFLSIMTSRYAEEDFLHVLPTRLCIGLLTLFTSITFMMVAFCTAIYFNLTGRSSLFIIPAAALGCLPVASFVFLQFPLLIAVMYSTYGPGISVRTVIVCGMSDNEKALGLRALLYFIQFMNVRICCCKCVIAFYCLPLINLRICDHSNCAMLRDTMKIQLLVLVKVRHEIGEYNRH